MILNHSNETGGKLEFSETLDDGYNRILSTPMRSNCTVLSALSCVIHRVLRHDAAAVADVCPFKLVRQHHHRHPRRPGNHWENTQENLFCMQALGRYYFRQAYEKTAPAMHVSVSAWYRCCGQCGLPFG